MRITKATLDQLQILVLVARLAPRAVPAATIAEALGFAQPNALKLINRLVHADLLSSKRGPGGGVVLARPASSISLGAAVTALEALNTTSHRLDWSMMEFRSENILETAFALFLEVLDQHTLADLATKNNAPKIARGVKIKRPRRSDARSLQAG